MFSHSVARQLISSLLFLIPLLALLVTLSELGATSSANSRFEAQTPAFVISKSYSRTSQKARAKKSNARADRWFTFKGPDGDFTLFFPAKPSQEQATEGPVTDIRTYSLTTVEGMRFSVNFNDIGGDPNARENNQWAKNAEDLIAAADRKSGSRVVQIHRLERNVVETELWQSVPDSGAKIHYIRRSILRRARVYTLACGSVVNGEAVDKPICLKFFASLRFTKTSPVSVK